MEVVIILAFQGGEAKCPPNFTPTCTITYAYIFIFVYLLLLWLYFFTHSLRN